MRREPALYRGSEKQRENKNLEFGIRNPERRLLCLSRRRSPEFRTVNSGSYNYLTENS